MRVLILFVLCGAWLSLSSFQSETIEMADGIRANGLIYIVVAIFVIMALGILFYLFSLDRKIKKMENESRETEKE